MDFPHRRLAPARASSAQPSAVWRLHPVFRRARWGIVEREADSPRTSRCAFTGKPAPRVRAATKLMHGDFSRVQATLRLNGDLAEVHGRGEVRGPGVRLRNRSAARQPAPAYTKRADWASRTRAGAPHPSARGAPRRAAQKLHDGVARRASACGRGVRPATASSCSGSSCTGARPQAAQARMRFHRVWSCGRAARDLARFACRRAAETPQGAHHHPREPMKSSGGLSTMRARGFAQFMSGALRDRRREIVAVKSREQGRCTSASCADPVEQPEHFELGCSRSRPWFRPLQAERAASVAAEPVLFFPRCRRRSARRDRDAAQSLQSNEQFKPQDRGPARVARRPRHRKTRAST